MPSLETLRKAQAKVLADLGFDAEDIEAALDWAIEHLPDDADPDTYIPDADDLGVEIADEDVERARAAWMASDAVPNRYKRLLEAEEEGEDEDREIAGRQMTAYTPVGLTIDNEVAERYLAGSDEDWREGKRVLRVLALPTEAVAGDA